MVIVTYMIE